MGFLKNDLQYSAEYWGYKQTLYSFPKMFLWLQGRLLVSSSESQSQMKILLMSVFDEYWGILVKLSDKLLPEQ